MIASLFRLTLLGLLLAALPVQAGSALAKRVTDMCSDKAMGISKKARQVGLLTLELERKLQKAITKASDSGQEIEQARAALQAQEDEILWLKTKCVKDILKRAKEDNADANAVNELWDLMFSLRDGIQPTLSRESARPKCYGKATLIRALENILSESSPNLADQN